MYISICVFNDKYVHQCTISPLFWLLLLLLKCVCSSRATINNVWRSALSYLCAGLNLVHTILIRKQYKQYAVNQKHSLFQVENVKNQNCSKSSSKAPQMHSLEMQYLIWIFAGFSTNTNIGYTCKINNNNNNIITYAQTNNSVHDST